MYRPEQAVSFSTMACKSSVLFVYRGCCDTMLSHGRRTVKSQRFGERGSGPGGGADSSCLSVSMETDCIKQTLNGQTELWPLGRGRGREDVSFQQLELGAPCSSLTDDKGPMMSTSGFDLMGGSQCWVGQGRT